MTARQPADELPEIDWEMLAADMSKMLSRCEHPIDVADEDLLPHLREFVAASLATARENEARRAAAARAVTETPHNALEPGPVLQTGPPPEMTYRDWFESEGTWLGSCGPDQHYWRCPTCDIWAGPFRDGHAAKGPGMDHAWEAHYRPKELRRTAAAEVRKASTPRMLIAEFDRVATELAARCELDLTTVYQVFACVARAITRRDRVADLMLELTSYVRLSPDQAAIVGADAATCLGHAGWLSRSDGRR